MSAITPPTGDDEARVLAAWRALPRLEPPAALDQCILAAARAQATGSPTADARPAASAAPGRGSRWPTLWATAAVLTLAVGVSWQLRQQHPGVATPPSPASAPTSAPDQVDDGAAAPAAGETAHRRHDTGAEAGTSSAERADDRAAAAGATITDGAPQAAARMPALRSNDSEAVGAVAVPPAAAPMPQSAPLPQTKPERPRHEAARPAATATAPPPAAAPASMLQARAREETAAAPSDSVAAPAAAFTKSASDAADPAAEAIARIRELIAANRIDAAREAAARFIIEHPDARLPDDLAWLAAPR